MRDQREFVVYKTKRGAYGLRIILEGPDGSSKTTQAHALARIYGIPVVKMLDSHEYFKKGNIEEAAKIFNSTLGQFDTSSFILDRGFVSTLVYAKIFKRSVDTEYLHKINRKLEPLVIILTATEDELRKRRPTDRVIEEQFRNDIRTEYIGVAERYSYPIVDTTGMTPGEVTKELRKIVDEYIGTEFKYTV